MELDTGWIVQFLQNICLFAGIVLSYRETIRLVRSDAQRSASLGAMFGVAAIIGALLPVPLSQGLCVDSEVLPVGLSVVQGIVRNHGGLVQVSNEPGAGAWFDVHFPLAEPTPAAEPIRAAC